MSCPAVIHSCRAYRCQHVHTSHLEAWVTTVINNWESNNVSSPPSNGHTHSSPEFTFFCFVPGIFPFYLHRRLTVWYEFIVSRYWSVDSYLPYVFANTAASALMACSGSAVVVQLSTLGHQPPLHEMTGGMFYINRDRTWKRSFSLLTSTGKMQHHPNIKPGWTS
jgi:hypothetical protein